jgi:hypothetical protein
MESRGVFDSREVDKSPAFTDLLVANIDIPTSLSDR